VKPVVELLLMLLLLLLLLTGEDGTHNSDGRRTFSFVVCTDPL